jgi:nitrate/nitrite transporter NarK
MGCCYGDGKGVYFKHIQRIFQHRQGIECGLIQKVVKMMGLGHSFFFICQIILCLHMIESLFHSMNILAFEFKKILGWDICPYPMGI